MCIRDSSQILYGDILLLNKCDLVTDKHLKKIESHINSIKKESRILRSINSEVSLQTIMSVGLFETDTFQFKEKMISNQDYHSHDHSSHSHDHSSHSHDHSSHSHDHSSHSHDLINNIEGFTSISFDTNEPFSLRTVSYTHLTLPTICSV